MKTNMKEYRDGYYRGWGLTGRQQEVNRNSAVREIREKREKAAVPGQGSLQLRFRVRQLRGPVIFRDDKSLEARLFRSAGARLERIYGDGGAELVEHTYIWKR